MIFVGFLKRPLAPLEICSLLSLRPSRSSLLPPSSVVRLYAPFSKVGCSDSLTFSHCYVEPRIAFPLGKGASGHMREAKGGEGMEGGIKVCKLETVPVGSVWTLQTEALCLPANKSRSSRLPYMSI